ncbi:MAG: response regulator [Verrucomicrobia bacterium]|nr:response regulator [Verrucomicrobiota bacterium]
MRLPFIPAGEATRLEKKYPDEAGAEPRASDEWLENLYHRADLLPGMNSGRRPLPARPAPHRPDLLSVLIAEDEPDMLRFLKMQLENHYQVLEATTGQQAIDETRRSLPDLVLLDMMMPEKDGLQVCQESREHAATRNIPVVLLTARADEETRLAALSAGASDFLSKPFSTTELQVRVRNLVESSQYQKSLARQNQVLKRTLDELKETESQLVQSEKLASLGRMSAGMIHEINNPLTYAKTGLYTLRQYAQGLPPPQRACFEETLGDIEDGITRIKNIVADLGPFTRQQSDARDVLRVEAVVEVALRFLSHDVKDAVKVEKAIPPDLVLWGNQTLVIQVLINLLQNSLDALKQKQFVGEQATIWITGRTEHDRCHPAGDHAQSLRAFLFHQRGGRGHGIGLEHLLPHHAGAPREN